MKYGPGNTKNTKNKNENTNKKHEAQITRREHARGECKRVLT
jgi:hypothetical protein